MIQIVFFAYCTESVVYMFLIPKQWNRNIDWNSLCACFEIVLTHKPGTVSKTPFKQWFCQNYRNDVFANCTKSSVYMFFFPKQWNRNIKWNSLYACFYIVWTHNPGTNSKNTILPFLAKCCKSLLIVPNLLFICFYFQIGNKSKNFRNQFYCNSNWVGDTFHREDLFQGKCC